MWLWWWLTLISLIFWGAVATADEHHPNVIILSSYHQGYEWTDRELAGLLDKLYQVYPLMDPAIEYLDAKRFPGHEQVERMKRYLADKYRGEKIDLVIVLDNPALDFMLDFRKSLFPGVPLVFAGINGFTPSMLKGQEKITGVAEVLDYADTLDLALSLQPKGKEVLVIHDYTTSGLVAAQEMEKVAHTFKGRVKVSFTPPATFEEILKQLELLPPGSTGLITGLATDHKKVSLGLVESTRLLATAAVPLYALHETRLGHGIVGGYLLEGQEHGRRAGELALKILAGGNPSQIPVITKSTAKPIFDYIQLTRFKIPLDRLPKGSIVINRPITFYDQYKQWIWTVTGITTFLSLVILVLSTSIIRRCKAETALLASETALRSIIDCTAEAIITVDLNRVITAFNPAFTRMLGYTAAEVLGQSVSLIHPSPESFQKFGEMVYPEIAAKGIWKGEYPLKKKDRTLIPTEMSLAPQRLPDGTLIGYIGAHTDISDRKQAEEAMAQEAIRRRILVEQSRDGIVVLDQNGKVYEANRRYAEMLGYSAEEVRQLYVWDWDAQYNRDEILEMLRTVDETGDHFGTRHRRQDGTIFDVEISTNGAVLGGQKLIFCVCRDISQRKAAERALRESEEKFRLSMEVTQDGVWDLDLKTGKIYYSPGWGKIFGFEPNEVSGDYNFWETRIHPDDKISTLQIFEKHLAGELPSFICEHRLLTKSGNYKWVLGRGRVISRDVDGKPLRAIGTMTDISKRKMAEEALRESETRFRSLFETMAEGVALHEILYDKNNIAIDYRIISVNPAFEKHTGLKADQIQGRLATEAYGTETAPYLEIYTQVVSLDQPQVFDTFFQPLERHFQVSVTSPQKDQFVTVFEDITERKQMEQVIRASEEKYRLLFENAPLGIMHYDEQGTIIDLNDKYAEIIGAPKGKIVGFNMRQQLQDEQMLVALTASLGGETGYYEGEYLSVTGGKKTLVRVFFQSIFSETGKFLGGVSIFEDFNDRFLAEKQLQESLSFLQTLMDAIPNPVFYKDLQGKYLGCNKACEEAWGRSREDLIGKSVFDQHPQDLAEIYFARDAELFAHPGVQVYETNIVHADGSRKDVILHKATFANLEGTLAGLIGVEMDITENKRAQHALEQSEARFRELFEKMSSAVAVYRPVGDREDFVFQEVNRALERIEQVKEEDLLGRKVTEVFPGVKDFGLLAVLRRVDHSGIPERFPAGLYQDQRISGWRDNYVYKLPSGEIVAVYDDITARKQAEAQVLDSLKEKEILLKEIHHRVKNNMQIISTLLAMQAKYDKGKNLAEVFKDCQNRIRSMSLIHESLYSAENLANINFRQYLEKLTNRLLSSYGSSTQGIKTIVAGTDIQLDISQAVPCGLIANELIVNSLKHAFKGRREGEIQVTIEAAADHRLMEIRDDGLGLGPDLDLENPTTFGLLMVRNLVKQLRGGLTVESNGGTCWRIVF